MLRSFPVETCTVRSYVRLHIDVFLYNANNMFWPKIITTLPDFYICICHRESNQQPLYHHAGFSHCYQCVIWMTSLRNFVIYRGDWLTIKFCGNDSFFKKLFLFFENTFQYLGGISQDISVSHFDSRRSLSSANWLRSTSPILFVSFTHPCDQHNRKILTIRKSAVRWHRRRARGYRKLIFRANLLHVPNIQM